MTFRPLAILALAALVAACSDPDPEPGGPGSTAGAGAGAGAGSGAQAGQPAPDTVEYFNVVVGDRVFFATDSSAIDPEAQGTLVRQARWLAENPAVSATIEGHADERGTREYNLALGARRADAVRSFLVSQGVAPSRLRTVTYGKERPVALCSDESCWSQNRRGVTVVAGAPTG
jgi:peptidoglycan-associated lipoprotein